VDKKIRISKNMKTPDSITMGAFNINSEWYRAIIHRSAEGFLLIKHPEGDILDVNDAFCNMLGCNREELLSMNIKDIEVGYDQSSVATQKKSDDIEKSGTTSFVTRNICKDGRIIDVSVNLRYLEEGVCFCFYRDITTQKDEQEKEQLNLKHVKETLKEAEDRYRTIIELGTKIGEAVIMIQDINGGEGVHTYVSDQWLNITGYSREELLSMSFFDLVIPEDRKAAIQRHRQKMGGKTISDLIEMYIIHKGGSEIPIEITSGATSYESQPANVVYIRDITERKQIEAKLSSSEKQYRALFENAPISLWEFDYSMTKKFIDNLYSQDVRDFASFFNKHPKAVTTAVCKTRAVRMNNFAINMMGGNIKDVNLRIESMARGVAIPSEEDTVVSIETICMLLRGKNTISRELQFFDLLGKPLYILQQVSIMPGYEDTWAKVVIANVNITELKNIEMELQKYQNHLEKMVEERTKALQEEIGRRIEFINLLVHEIKTPLTPLIASSDHLISITQESDLKDCANNINRGAIHLSERIDELVDLTKGEMGLLQIEIESFDLIELLEEVVEYVQATLVMNNQKLNLLRKSKYCPIQADERRIQQILLNLLDNAMKFTRKGGCICIEQDCDENSATVKITDTGMGIQPELIPSLFKPYNRLERRVRSEGGLGIGLSLCKMFIELHGGRIWAESEPGVGSSFYFSIPLAQTFNNSTGLEA
jgi:PAS domain S-box-containing protein